MPSLIFLIYYFKMFSLSRISGSNYTNKFVALYLCAKYKGVTFILRLSTKPKINIVYFEIKLKQ